MGKHNILTRLAEEPNEFILPDPGAGGTITPRKAFSVCLINTAAAEARSLSRPQFAGQQLTLAMKTDGGDATVTATAAINQTGNTVITLNDAGDTVHLVGIEDGSALEWRVVANDGASLS